MILYYLARREEKLAGEYIFLLFVKIIAFSLEWNQCLISSTHCTLTNIYVTDLPYETRFTGFPTETILHTESKGLDFLFLN